MSWTTEQVIALAPDSSSASAGKSLASPAKWTGLNADDRCLWGACAGSGANPYQVMVDLAEPAFKCSCPSRKFPCKHGLALLFLFASQPAAFGSAARSTALIEWIEKRDGKQEAKVQKEELPKTAAELEKLAVQAQKRADDREKKVAAGIEELELWLQDTVRQGLAAFSQGANARCSQRAARMVDAQCPGLAARILRFAEVLEGLDDQRKAERHLGELGRLQLLIDAYRNSESLSPAMQQTLRTHIGWPVRKEDVLETPAVADTYVSLGTCLQASGHGVTRFTYLYGQRTGRFASIISFGAPGQMPEPGIPPGKAFEGALCFYPGALPLRALVLSQQDAPADSIEEILANAAENSPFQRAFAEALSLDLWVQSYPVIIANVLITFDKSRPVLTIGGSQVLPASMPYMAGMQLLAFTGGGPHILTGEWDGYQLKPLAAFAGGRVLMLRSQEAA